MGFLDKIKSLFKSKKEIVNKETLRKEQEIIDELYERDGLTDEVLDKQVALNMKRNKYDIPDEENLNKDGWSQ